MTMDREQLGKMRSDAVEIFKSCLQPVDPYGAVNRFVHLDGDRLILGTEQNTVAEIDLKDYERISFVGAGKATAPMARAIEDLFGDNIYTGMINVKYGFTEELRYGEIIEAGHPVPDENSVRGTGKILDFLTTAGEKDLIFSLISGGGSALLCRPSGNIPLSDKQKITEMLLACGASIDEINAVRKHVSLTKGGQLARAAFPATVINLMLSDVVGDEMDVIASGPFVPDSSTFKDVQNVLGKYELKAVPNTVGDYLNSGLDRQVPETPKQGDRIFETIFNLIVGSNILALEAAQKRARQLGYETLVLSSMVQGETREVALVHSAIAKEMVKTGHPIPTPGCVISGGETTVTIRGTGLGGRNQEFCLAAALDLADLPFPVVILSAGTDGNDGPTHAAGAIVDPQTVKRGRDADMDPEAYLNNNDAYHFFEKTNDLLITGPTNTNVMDVRVVLVG
jgi:hydroxypyruvate reductase